MFNHIHSHDKHVFKTVSIVWSRRFKHSTKPGIKVTRVEQEFVHRKDLLILYLFTTDVYTVNTTVTDEWFLISIKRTLSLTLWQRATHIWVVAKNITMHVETKKYIFKIFVKILKEYLLVYCREYMDEMQQFRNKWLDSYRNRNNFASYISIIAIQ